MLAADLLCATGHGTVGWSASLSICLVETRSCRLSEKKTSSKEKQHWSMENLRRKWVGPNCVSVDSMVWHVGLGLYFVTLTPSLLRVLLVSAFFEDDDD